MKQAALDLSGAPELTFASFVEGDSNRRALTYVRAFPEWTAPVCLLVGPEGAGKTHLCEAFLASHDNVAIVDDADRMDEKSLFALINEALSGQISGLLLSSRRAPDQWAAQIPDLASRLRNVPAFTLDEPGDDILRPILVQLFFNEGRAVGPDVIDYMLLRCPRGVAELRAIVATIEGEAQSTKSDVTKMFVAKFLGQQPDLFG